MEFYDENIEPPTVSFSLEHIVRCYTQEISRASFGAA